MNNQISHVSFNNSEEKAIVNSILSHAVYIDEVVSFSQLQNEINFFSNHRADKTMQQWFYKYLDTSLFAHKRTLTKSVN